VKRFAPRDKTPIRIFYNIFYGRKTTSVYTGIAMTLAYCLFFPSHGDTDGRAEREPVFKVANMHENGRWYRL
jgi:hypothetical protein